MLIDKYGNASSQHSIGIESKKELDNARSEIAKICWS